jgi:hypothetical protein
MSFKKIPYEIEVKGFEILTQKTPVQISFERLQIITRLIASNKLELLDELNTNGITFQSKLICKELLSLKKEYDIEYAYFLRHAVLTHSVKSHQ